MNAPDREESVTLNDDEQKIYFAPDPKIPNAANFTIIKEDHTVGNTLVHQILRDEHVRFAGYRIPHPLENLIQVKIQTDGDEEPMDAMIKGVEDLMSEFSTLTNRFREALDSVRQETYDEFGMR